MTRTTSYQVHRADPLFGAEISGVDLTGRLDPDTADALRRDFLTHEVLVFRDQHLTPDRHVAAVAIFGGPGTVTPAAAKGPWLRHD
jgi:alpha-ketoglutarate-dependent taurine dioxygenase